MSEQQKKYSIAVDSQTHKSIDITVPDKPLTESAPVLSPKAQR